MKKIKGTNYIDHRFPCADMIKSILCCEGCIVPILLIINQNIYKYGR